MTNYTEKHVFNKIFDKILALDIETTSKLFKEDGLDQYLTYYHQRLALKNGRKDLADLIRFLINKSCSEVLVLLGSNIITLNNMREKLKSIGHNIKPGTGKEGDGFIFPVSWTDGKGYNERTDTEIHRICIWGQNEKGESTLWRYEEFHPFIYIKISEELHECMGKGCCTCMEYDMKAETLLRTLKKWLSRSNHGPTKVIYVSRKPLYYYTEKVDRLMELYFESEEALKHCINSFNSIKRKNFDCMKEYYCVCENNISKILKCVIEKDLQMYRWLKGHIIKPEKQNMDKISNLTNEFIVTDILCDNDLDILIHPPDALSFDLEVYSKRRKFPKAIYLEDTIFLGAIAYLNTIDGVTGYDCYVVTHTKKPAKTDISKMIGNLTPLTPNVHSITQLTCQDEEVFIFVLLELIKKLNPDVITGYNILGFDFLYIADRLEIFHKADWPNFSRFIDYKVWGKSDHWNSSGRGHIDYYKLDCPGYLIFDPLFILRIMHKRISYKLDSYSKDFLGVGKLDFPPDKIFDTYESNDINLWEECARYCIIDCILAKEVINATAIYESALAEANVTLISIYDTFVRGQGVKVINQIYAECRKTGYYMNKISIDKDFSGYKGAHVEPPVIGRHKNVFTLDFEGLYPSIMRRFNMCHTTIVKDKDIEDNKCYVRFYVDKEGNEHIIRYIKPEYRKGILPSRLEYLYDARQEAKKLMAEANRNNNKRKYINFNARQLALKVASNSIYGVMASKYIDYPCPEISRTVCETGQELVLKAKYEAIKLGAHVVYGDSVTYDTPILVKEDNTMKIIPIKHLGNNWYNYHENKEVSNVNNIEVWSDEGWTKINRIIKHKTEKKIIRILTNTGCVDVTEDHSLLDQSGSKIKPSECDIGTKLLHVKFPRRNDYEDFSKIKSPKGKLETAQNYFLFSNMGFSIRISNKGKYILSCHEEEKEDDDQIVELIDVTKRYKGAYVYDLETDNHHFQAGIGKMIVHNTDSIMINFPEENIPNDKLTDYGLTLAEEINKVFKKPINLEYEEVKQFMLCFTKKRYMYFVLDSQDPFRKLMRKYLKIKGLLSARRDNCQFARNVFNELGFKLILSKTYKDVGDAIEFVTEKCLCLLRRQIPLEDLVISQKVQKSYSENSTAYLKKFKNRMSNKGIELSPNERIPYVIVKKENKKLGVGDKMELYEYYYKEEHIIDSLHYIKKYAKPWEEIFEYTHIGLFGKGAPYNNYIRKIILKKFLNHEKYMDAIKNKKYKLNRI